jgi:hypothetical protein
LVVFYTKEKTPSNGDLRQGSALLNRDHVGHFQFMHLLHIHSSIESIGPRRPIALQNPFGGNNGHTSVMLSIEKPGKGLAIDTVTDTPIDVFGRLEYGF